MRLGELQNYALHEERLHRLAEAIAPIAQNYDALPPGNTPGMAWWEGVTVGIALAQRWPEVAARTLSDMCSLGQLMTGHPAELFEEHVIQIAADIREANNAELLRRDN